MEKKGPEVQPCYLGLKIDGGCLGGVQQLCMYCQVVNDVKDSGPHHSSTVLQAPAKRERAMNENAALPGKELLIRIVHCLSSRPL